MRFQRWTERDEHSESKQGRAERRAAELFRSAQRKPDFTEHQQEVWRRIEATVSSPDAQQSALLPFESRRVRPRRKRLTMALAAAALCSGGALFASFQLSESAPEPQVVKRTESAPAQLAPKLVTPKVSHSETLREHGGASGAESELLLRALRQLRSEKNPAAALATLDTYDQQFTRGVLSTEAAVTRVEALLALKRHAEALKLLQTLPLSRLPRGRELGVLRGELRGSLGDCAGAIEDFDRMLGEALGPLLASRALYGRGSCRLRLGQRGAGEKDFRQYLQRFPDGAFAAAVERALVKR